jgi:hypothetical protein
MNDLDAAIHEALRSPHFDAAIDTRELLAQIQSRRTPTHRATSSGSAWAAAAAAIAALLVAVTLHAVGSTPRRSAGAPSSATAASPGADARPPEVGPTFPLTPGWLPYGLSTADGVTEGSSNILDITSDCTDGPEIQITIADAHALESIAAKQHFAITATTVGGLAATLALPQAFEQNGHRIDRTGDRYLLFQRYAGAWVMIRAGAGRHVPADSATLVRIATGILPVPLHVRSRVLTCPTSPANRLTSCCTAMPSTPLSTIASPGAAAPSPVVS